MTPSRLHTTRIGLAALALVSVTVSASACIFERSDYQGGGRKDQGAEGTTADPSASTAPLPTPTVPPDSSIPDTSLPD